MANPTNRTSKARKRMRRSHLALVAPNFSYCPQCHEPKLAHRVCGKCGYYKDRKAVEIKETV